MKRYFAYSPDNGMSFFDTASAAKTHAQSDIDDCRDSMDEGWDEEFVVGICWGKVSETATEVIEPGVYGSDYELMEVKSSGDDTSSVCDIEIIRKQHVDMLVALKTAQGFIEQAIEVGGFGEYTLGVVNDAISKAEGVSQ